MKSINETFSYDEHRRLKKLKGDLTWRNFILLMFNYCVASQGKEDVKVYKNE